MLFLGFYIEAVVFLGFCIEAVMYRGSSAVPEKAQADLEKASAMTVPTRGKGCVSVVRVSGTALLFSGDGASGRRRSRSSTEPSRRTRAPRNGKRCGAGEASCGVQIYSST